MRYVCVRAAREGAPYSLANASTPSHYDARGNAIDIRIYVGIYGCRGTIYDIIFHRGAGRCMRGGCIAHPRTHERTHT